MPALTVHNAEIKTAAVEIRTLTISGKQVTLAVFRQLLEEQLVSSDGAFVGLPWGVINYHPDKCADDSRHLHVVWQNGVDLRRAKVAKPRFGEAVWPEAGADWLDAAVLDGWRATALQSGSHLRPEEIRVRFDAGVAEIDTDRPGIKDALWPFMMNVRYGATDDERAAVEADKRRGPLETIRERSSSLSLSSLRSEVNAEVAAELARRERHLARWSELEALPQLFIAV